MAWNGGLDGLGSWVLNLFVGKDNKLRTVYNKAVHKDIISAYPPV